MPKKENSRLAAPQAGAYYAIVSAHSGKAVTAGVNNRLYMGEATGGENQQWAFVPVGEWYKLVNRFTGDVADVILAGVENGAQLHQWEDLEADNQLWALEPAREGLWKLKSKPSGKCLDVVGISQEEGASLQIWEDLDGENQLWKLLEPAELAEQPAQAPAKKPASRAKKEPAAKQPAAKKPAAPKADKQPAAKKPAAPKADKQPAAKKPAAPKADKQPAAKDAQKPAAKTGEKRPARKKAAAPKPEQPAPSQAKTPTEEGKG